MRNAIVGIVVVFGVMWGIGYALSMGAQRTINPVAANNTFKNAFVSSCVTEASKIEGGDNEAGCTCGYERLMDMYPDFDTNTERLNRIIQEGYSREETDATTSCWTEQEGEVI